MRQMYEIGAGQETGFTRISRPLFTLSGFAREPLPPNGCAIQFRGLPHASMLASCRRVALRFSTQSLMARADKLLDQILRGGVDANIPFSRMVQLLKHLGLQERIKGSHYIFYPRRSRRNS